MKRCPKCGKPYEAQYNFCPDDAIRLEEIPAGESALGAAVPTRGWTAVMSAVTDAPPTKPAAPASAPAPEALGSAVPTRGWTQAFAAVDSLDVPKAAAPAPAPSIGEVVPTRGWTQAFAAVDALESKPAPAAENPTPAEPVRGFTQVFAAVDALDTKAAPASTAEPARGFTQAFAAVDALDTSGAPAPKTAPRAVAQPLPPQDDLDDQVPANRRKMREATLVIAGSLAIAALIFLLARAFL